MKTIFALMIMLLVYSSTAQSYEQLTSRSNSEKKLMIGGYAQIEYRQPIISGESNNGKLDVHRMVLLFGYRFNDKISFMSEIEVEHASEIYLEQAYINYRFKNWLQLRAGLLLIPMGIINENHEPPTFNGVVRPSLDKYIVPTTWREIGFGFTGNIREASVNYSFYVINGVVSYKDGPTLNGASGIRGGRQKGISSLVGSPSFAGRLEYFGVKSFRLGASIFSGNTQTSLNTGLSVDDQQAIDTRDSSIVGMTMIGLDARYEIEGISFRGQFNYAMFSNTLAYNTFTGSDLGEGMIGYYAEIAYNVFHGIESVSHTLTPFVRYENYNTQYGVSNEALKNEAYHREEITAGIGWKPIANVAFKADYQMIKPKSESKFSGILAVGLGLMF